MQQIDVRPRNGKEPPDKTQRGCTCTRTAVGLNQLRYLSMQQRRGVSVGGVARSSPSVCYLRVAGRDRSPCRGWA